MRSWKVVEDSLEFSSNGKGSTSDDAQEMDQMMSWTLLQKIVICTLLLIAVTIVTYVNSLILSAAARSLLLRGDNGAMASIDQTYAYFVQSVAAAILLSGIGSYFALRKSVDRYLRRSFTTVRKQVRSKFR